MTISRGHRDDRDQRSGQCPDGAAGHLRACPARSGAEQQQAGQRRDADEDLLGDLAAAADRVITRLATSEPTMAPTVLAA